MQEETYFADELYSVIDFKIIGDYALYLKFDDESEKIINFEPILLGNLFGQLRDLTLFNQVRLDYELGTLVWPNDADIDPTVLHDWERHVDSIVQRRMEKSSRDKTAIPDILG